MYGMTLEACMQNALEHEKVMKQCRDLSESIHRGGITIDKYAKVEEILKDYTMIKINIENMEEEINLLRDKDGITAICSEGGGGGGSGEFNGVTERTALTNLEDIKRLEEDIRKASLSISKLERALGGLTDTDRTIIEGKYFEGLQWYQIAYSVGHGERQCQRRRVSAIKYLVKGIYGNQRESVAFVSPLDEVSKV